MSDLHFLAGSSMLRSEFPSWSFSSEKGALSPAPIFFARAKRTARSSE